jgi:serine/threonine-protein kinase
VKVAQAFFVSYSSADAVRAQEICALLKSIGAPYWMAPDSIMPGEPYPVAIAKAIRESYAVLLLFSKSSDQSPDVMNELSLARNHQKRVVPIRLENYAPANLEYFLGVAQWIDFYDPLKAEGQRRLQRLVADLCGVSTRPASSPNDTRPAPGPGVVSVAGPLGPGDRLSSHTVLDMIASGGIGRIFRARDDSSGRMDGIWVIGPELTNNVEMSKLCRDGIQIQAKLHHPSIAEVYTPLMVGTRPGMIMEWVDGFSIDALLQKAPIPAAVAIPAVVQVLEALSYIHSVGVVHRNIKPGTLMLNLSGKLKLLGFHLAYQRGVSPLPNGRIIGSVDYMPPEQIHGLEADPRSDIYSLGITLYEMVTGRLPFTGNSEFSVMQAHLQQTPRAPMDIAPVVPRNLNDLILKAMSKDAGARFGSADAMRNALAPVAMSAGRNS